MSKRVIKRRNQPWKRGITRDITWACVHREVAESLRQIADSEGKTISYVVAEIIYAFFGLEVTKEKVNVKNKNYHLISAAGKKIADQGRRKSTGKYYAH